MFIYRSIFDMIILTLGGGKSDNENNIGFINVGRWKIR